MEPGVVSIVIPFIGNLDDLSTCIQGIKDQTWKQTDLIIIDNGTGLLQAPLNNSRIIQNSANEGFAKAINQGYKVARGEYLLALNADAFLDPDYVEVCIDTFRENPSLAGVTGKLRKTSPSDVIDSTGHLLLADRTVRDRGEWEFDRGQFDREEEVFSIPATAALYRMAALRQLESKSGEVFDEDFFAYGEDVDLCWRLRLMGWGIAYAPSAAARHRRSVSTRWGRAPRYVTLLDIRNRWLRIVKNDQLVSVARHFVRILFSEVRQMGGLLMNSPSLIPRSIGGFLRRLPKALGKRKSIQRGRSVDRREIEKWFVNSE